MRAHKVKFYRRMDFMWPEISAYKAVLKSIKSALKRILQFWIWHRGRRVRKVYWGVRIKVRKGIFGAYIGRHEQKQILRGA